MKTSPPGDRRPVRIIGLGNVLQRDEGAGIHAVRHLQNAGGLPRHVECVDGGTGGFVLLSALQDASRVILVDATNDGQLPGTITRLAPRFARDYPPALAAHDVGLRDLLETSELLGHAVPAVLYTVSIDMPQPLGTELSPPVAACLPGLASRIRAEVESSSLPC